MRPARYFSIIQLSNSRASKLLIRDNAHLIFRFSQERGILNASVVSNRILFHKSFSENIDKFLTKYQTVTGSV